MRRRRVIIAVVCILFVLAGGWALFASRNAQDTDGTGNTETLNVETDGLAPVIPQLPSIGAEEINTSLMGIIRMNIPNPESAYDAKYRNGSIERSQASTGAPIVSFLVDIPDLQRTFRIETEGNDDTPSKTIYALCPLPGQSMYGEKECNDTP